MKSHAKITRYLLAFFLLPLYFRVEGVERGDSNVQFR